MAIAFDGVKNRLIPLSCETIASLAKMHGVAVNCHSGRVELREDAVDAGGQWVSEWVDATGWTIGELLTWLGY